MDGGSKFLLHITDADDLSALDQTEILGSYKRVGLAVRLIGGQSEPAYF